MTTVHECPNCGSPFHMDWTTNTLNQDYREKQCFSCGAVILMKLEVIIDSWKENPSIINYGEAR